MTDDLTFPPRLAEALGRLADMAPSMDDEAIARRAIAAGRAPGRFPWLVALRGAWLDLRPGGGAGLRVAYLLVVLALLLAAILVAVAIGAFRADPFPPRATNGRIVFTVQGNDHGPAGTHLMNADGSSDQLLDAGRCPSWSTNGNVLASVSYAAAADLVIAGIDGAPTRRVRLVDEPSTSVPFALSPDGTRVAWFKPIAATEGVELWVAPIDGGAGRRIAPDATTPPASYDSPRWSPDSSQIAFEGFVKDAATGERRRSGIWVVAADGSRLRRITARPANVGAGLSWSPDGRFLSYVALPDGTPFSSSSPGVAPNPEPAADIFVVGADGSGDQDVTRSETIEDRPEWAPDGAILAFRTSADGEAHRLTTVHMNGPTAAGRPVLGPETDWFVWAPDGTQLLWLEVSSLGAEAHRSTVHAIDPDGRRPSTTLAAVDGLIVCTPSWQRLER